MANYHRRLDVLEHADFDFLSNVQEQHYRESIEVYNYTYVRRRVEQIAPQAHVTPQYATVPDTPRPGVAYGPQDSPIRSLAMIGNAPLHPTTMPYGSNMASNTNRSEPRWDRNGASSFYASNVQYTSRTVRSERANLSHYSAQFGSHMAPRRTQAIGVVAPYSSAYTPMEANSNLAPRTSLSGIGAASNTTICASQSWSYLANSSALRSITPRRTHAVDVQAPYTTAYMKADSNLPPSTSQSGIGAANNAVSNTTISASQSWFNAVNGSTQAVETPYTSAYTATETDSNLAPSTSQSGIGAAYTVESNTTIYGSQSWSNPVNGSTLAVVTPYTSAYAATESDSNLAPSTSQSGIGASYNAVSNTTISASQSWFNPVNGSTQAVVTPYTSAYAATESDSNLAPSTSQSGICAAYNAASNSTICASQSCSNLGNGSTEFGSDLAPIRTQTVGVEAPYTSDYTSMEADSNLAPSTSHSGIDAAYNASYAASNISIWTGQSWSNLAHGSTQSQSNMLFNGTQHKSVITVTPSRSNLDQSSTVLQSNTVSYEAQHTASNTRAAQSWSNLGHGSTQQRSSIVSPALHTSLNTTVRAAETRIKLGHGSTQSQSNEVQDTSPHATAGIAQSKTNLTTLTSQSNTGSNVAQHTSNIAVSSTQSSSLAGTSQSQSKIASAQPQSQNIETSLHSQTGIRSHVTPQGSTSRDEKLEFGARIISNETCIQSRTNERKCNFFAWDKCVRQTISCTQKTERRDSKGSTRNEGTKRTKRNGFVKAKRIKKIKMMYECKMTNCHLLRNLENMIRHLSTDHGIEEPNLRRDTYTRVVCPTCQACVRERVYNKHVLKWHSKKKKNAKKQKVKD